MRSGAELAARPPTQVRPGRAARGLTTRQDDSVPEGVVKWFSQDRGYGFITPVEGGKDVFVHVSGIQGSGLGGLEEGQRVSFEVEQDPRGPKATRVVPL